MRFGQLLIMIKKKKIRDFLTKVKLFLSTNITHFYCRCELSRELADT